MPMQMSKLEKNLAHIRRSPQACEDFENAMVSFSAKYGQPDESDLEIITTIVLNDQKWWYNPTRAVLVLAIIVTFIAIMLKELMFT